jgi:hypothetical protein
MSEKIAKLPKSTKVDVKVEDAVVITELDKDIHESKKLDFERLKLGGGDVWLIQLDGSVAGVKYEFNLAKMVKFVSQITTKTVGKDEDELRYFTYAVVITAQGQSLKLPLSEGLYLTHYYRYCDANGTINPNHTMDDLRINFTVFIESENGREVLDKEGRPKKKVGQVFYTELETAPVA